MEGQQQRFTHQASQDNTSLALSMQQIGVCLIEYTPIPVLAAECGFYRVDNGFRFELGGCGSTVNSVAGGAAV